MNEQQRQAVERVTANCRTRGRSVLLIREDVRTLLALIDHPTTCFECETELQGPFCPKCSGDQVGVYEELRKRLGEFQRSVLGLVGDLSDRVVEEHAVAIERICTAADNLSDDAINRLSAPVRS